MKTIKSSYEDLNIETEVLPLFDHSLNAFSKNKVLELLREPLGSVEAIQHRQNILKGFSANSDVLSDYSYTILYLNEVYFFLKEEKIADLSQQKLRYKLFASRKEKAGYVSRFNQMILLFHRIESRYLKRLCLEPFPEDYARAIKGMLAFLSHFQLDKYERVIREQGLTDAHIIELTRTIHTLKEKDGLAPFWEELFLFEAYLSISLGVAKHHFSYPQFTKGEIKLTGLFHPLLKDPVKNNFETDTHVMVLNGPNMSGKSTFLKAVALCVYLGHLGFGIPASAGALPFFDHFSIGINRRDDILNGYSHFMSEVMGLKRVVEKASSGQRCFAVFDELFSGTNAEDAFEICKTTINGLRKFNTSFFFISTHLNGLKEVSNQHVANYYMGCDLVSDQPMFTYQLEKGWSEIRVGRILFEKEGLNTMLDQ